MSLLLDIFGFVSVVLRGFILTAQSFTFGGIAFLALLVRPLQKQLGPAGNEILRQSLGFLRVSAFSLAVAGCLALGLNGAVLVGTLQMPWLEALGAGFARTDMIVIAAALIVAALTLSKSARRFYPLMIVAGLVILAAQISSTHAVSRLGARWHLILADAIHMLGAGVWIGGLPYFLIALQRVEDGPGCRLVGRRYSLMSMASVGVIVVGGVVMAVSYVGSLEALYGTAYGVMTATKALLLGLLLILGGMNYLTVEALRRDPSTATLRLKRFAEVEIGLGLTVLFVAASLTSLPPGEDLTQDRVTLHEIADRMTPPWPIRLASPDHDQLAIPLLEARIASAQSEHAAAPQAFVPGEGIVPPRNASDIAWSEYNHHWAGLFVILIALLAMIEHFRWGKWARHWPVLFLGMAAFLFVRSDPEVWPLGHIGFFESLRDPEVVQHRIFVVLIVVFGLFEWRVRADKIEHPKAALVFPLMTALGGMLMLTHSHALANLKDQLLIEVSHVPLALSGIIAGWARWLELRLDGPVRRVASWVWPIAFLTVGVILLIYHEA